MDGEGVEVGGGIDRVIEYSSPYELFTLSPDTQHTLYASKVDIEHFKLAVYKFQT